MTTSLVPAETATARLRALGISVDDTALTRSLYAHDASNYRIQPAAVVFPRSTQEVVNVTRVCAESGVSITARGSGTGMAGNTVGAGFILDFRRFMRSVLEVDAVARTARVQPGVVLDELQHALADHHLMFGPDPSSHSRATIGGMVGNDACGNHSVAYGRTSDHVLALEVVLADGTQAVATRAGLSAMRPEEQSKLDALMQQLHGVATEYGDELRSEFARAPRQVSGYAAHRLLPENGFDIARLLVGSEGSLAIVVSATLALVDVPSSTQLLVLGYPDLIAAARDVPTLLPNRPSAIEALDAALVATMRARRGDAAIPTLPDGDAWLFVEFANTVAVADLDAVARQMLRMGNAVSAEPIVEPEHRAAIWRIREDGAGLASNLLDGTRGKPGWEDAAVPPQQLADYLEGLQQLQGQHGFRGVLYGHFGAGCVHVRFDFDTASTTGQRAMRAFILDAARLVAACGGSVSGEHGDGRARSELLPVMYSPAALGAFRAIKRAFDPHGRLNPEVIVDAPKLTEHLPHVGVAQASTFALREDGGLLGHAVDRCVGIGRCVAVGVNAMCPTYDVSQLEAHSTRGRARALQDLWNGTLLSPADALQALDTCLACKACTTECPTGVDMTTYKAEFLHRHFRRRLRPMSHYTLGWLPAFAHTAQRFAPLINRALEQQSIRSLLAPLLGISRTRRFPKLADPRSRKALAEVRTTSAPRAILFIDTLTQAFDPQLPMAAVRVLEAAGIPVLCLLDGDSGLTWISTGQLDRARKVQLALLDRFDRLPTQLPVIVLEPSYAATLVHDLPALVRDGRAEALAARIRTFTQALDELAADWRLPRGFPQSVVLQPHCHERAVFTQHAQSRWLRDRGVIVREAIGCCGMGGNFGFEQGHEAISIAVAQRSLLPAIDTAATDTAILADGFGCRCQIADLRPTVQPRHLAEVLAEFM